MNHPVTQPVSSLLSLLIGSRFEDRLVRKVKSVFASETRYRKSSQERYSLFEQFDQILGNKTSDYPRRSPCVSTATYLVAARFAVNMISFLTRRYNGRRWLCADNVARATARSVQSRPHTYSPFPPWNQSQRTCSFRWDSSGALSRDHVTPRLLSMNSSGISRS